MTTAFSDSPPKSHKAQKRFLSAWFPYLPTDRVMRQVSRSSTPTDPEDIQPQLPLVIVDKVRGATRLSAVSPEARRLGLQPGLTLPDARVRIPDLWVEEADHYSDAVLLDRIAEDCDRFSPTVMADAPDGVTMEITGCGHLFGGEAALRKAFSERMRRAGLRVRSVVAGAPDTGRALARHGRVAVVAPGGDAAAVWPLPIVALGLEEDVRIAISRAGLKTVGAVAERPSRAFAARFGEKMTLRLRRVLGEEAPLCARRAVPVVWVERRFAEPIGRAEDVESVLGELAAEAGCRLEERREGGRVFEASFFRADGVVRRIAIETGRPMRDAVALLRLFREKLDALADPIDPGFGFDVIRLAVLETDALDAVQAGLDGRAIEENEVADLADRLGARFGRDRVVRFVAENTHDPDRAARAVPAEFNPVTSAVWEISEADEPPLRPTQIFDPPQLVTATAEVPDGPPLSFRWRKSKYVVRRGEGPERIAPEWWRAGPDAQARDYYRVEDEEGRRFWLFRAGLYGEASDPRWYLHGLFA